MEKTAQKTALLCIDLQNDYFEGGKFPLVGINQASENAARVMAAFRGARIPVIHIRHEILRKPAPFFEPNSEGAQIHKSAAPMGDEVVITKNFPNSFRETELMEHLKGIDKLVIIGAMSHFCIDATARAACDFGFACIVAHDACATRDMEFDGVQVSAAQVHASFMAGLNMGYGAVISSDQVIAQVTGSGHKE